MDQGRVQSLPDLFGKNIDYERFHLENSLRFGSPNAGGKDELPYVGLQARRRGKVVPDIRFADRLVEGRAGMADENFVYHFGG